MKTTTYTKQQVIDFINSQPDERPIKFTESMLGKEVPDAECGCLLVHLFQRSFPEVTREHTICCGFSHAECGQRLVSTPEIRPGAMHELTTYGQLKQHIDQLFTK